MFDPGGSSPRIKDQIFPLSSSTKIGEIPYDYIGEALKSVDFPVLGTGFVFHRFLAILKGIKFAINLWHTKITNSSQIGNQTFSNTQFFFELIVSVKDLALFDLRHGFYTKSQPYR